MDRVGARHQRRVQGGRDLADDLEAAQDRQHEDAIRQFSSSWLMRGLRGAVEQLLAPAWTTAPPWVMTVAAVISSLKSKLSVAVLDEVSSSAEMLRA